MLVDHVTATKTKLNPARRSRDEFYRNFQLVAGQRGDGFSSVAYAGRTSMFAGSGSDLDAALDDIKDQIDKDFAHRAARLQNDGLSAADFELALALVERQMPPAVHHVLEMLADETELSLLQVERRAGIERDALVAQMLRFARAIAGVYARDPRTGPDNARSTLNLIVEQIIGHQSTDETWTFRLSFVEAARSYLKL